MSERSIRKLKRNFVTAAMVTLTAVMLMIGGFIYVANVLITRQVIRERLHFIVEHKGVLNETESYLDGQDDINGTELGKPGLIRFVDEIIGQSMQNYNFSELQHATRYFALVYNDEGELSEIVTNHIAGITPDDAREYGDFAQRQLMRFGRIGVFYYLVDTEPDGDDIVVFMDGTEVLASNNRILYVALTLFAFGIVVSFFLVNTLSNRAIEPELRNAELQKQFITNASHELKTPLAVIRANTEMQEILEGESEWTTSTLRQIERMDGLIRNLVLIARAGENSNKDLILSQIDVTKVVKETADTFSAITRQDGKELHLQIADGVTMRADEGQIRQLTSLLLDNAIKYCDDKGTVGVELLQKGHGIILIVSNSYEAGQNVDYSKFFERFYREDKSHNTDRGGYGIGLSIAESIVKQYAGTIDASWKKGIISFTCVLKHPVEIMKFDS